MTLYTLQRLCGRKTLECSKDGRMALMATRVNPGAGGQATRVGARSREAWCICENCDSAVLGEGKAQEALGWVPLGHCPHPHSHVEMEAPSHVLRAC